MKAHEYFMFFAVLFMLADINGFKPGNYIHINTDTKRDSIKPSGFFVWTGSTTNWIKNETDTIPAIILLSDTTITTPPNGFKTYAIKGYVVRAHEIDKTTGYKFTNHKTYLDHNQNQLPKKLIVWQFKEF